MAFEDSTVCSTNIVPEKCGTIKLQILQIYLVFTFLQWRYNFIPLADNPAGLMYDFSVIQYQTIPRRDALKLRTRS